MGNWRPPATPETHLRPHHRVYRLPYIAAHGPGPYTCAKCGESMEKLEVVHHIDHDPWNNELSNLQAMHTTCHNQNHHDGITMSDESNRQRSRTLKASRALWTDEQRNAVAEKTRELWTGRKHRPEVLAKMSEQARNRPRACCTGCKREMTINGLTRHHRETQCP